MWKTCSRGRMRALLKPILLESPAPKAAPKSCLTSSGCSPSRCWRDGDRLSMSTLTQNKLILPRDQLILPRAQLLGLTRHLSLSARSLADRSDDRTEEKQLSLAQKFKQMFKDYWYVLVPVHLATSIVWFGGFYIVAKSGVDIVSLLQALSIPEYYLDKLRSSEAGYYALAYACYKIATPIRYTVTIGGTTFTVARLKEAGYLRTTREVAEKMKDKKDDLKEKYEERRDKFKDEWETAWEKWAKKKQ